MLYIKFSIQNENKFKDFKKVFETIKELKDQDERHPIAFWLDLIPEHAKEYFNMSKIEDKPYVPGKMHFKRLVKYLQRDLEVQFDSLDILEKGKGILKFSTGNYPYGGMDKLILFTKTFACIPFEIFNGFDICQVIWEADYQFSCSVIPK